MLPVLSYSNELSKADKDIFEKSIQDSKALAAQMSFEQFSKRNMSNANVEAQALFEQLKTQGKTKISTPNGVSDISKEAKDPTDNSTQLVFISLSLGEAAIKQILDEVSEVKGATLVLRGVPEGMKLMEGISKIHSLINTRKNIPSVIINPTLFKEYKVDSVPTVVLLEKKGSGYSVKTRAVGIYNPSWLSKKYSENHRSDQGKVGPSSEISEPDLIEVAKKRILEIDWDEKKRMAIQNVWKKQKFLDVSISHKYAEKEIDPTVVITKDIKGADGKVIVKAGAKINPLDIRDFTQELIIFDATDKRQIEIAIKAAADIKKKNSRKKITFITTKIDAEDGWKSFKSITDKLNSHIFILSPDVAQRFQIESIPSVVRAVNKKFVVKTYSVEEGYK